MPDDDHRMNAPSPIPSYLGVAKGETRLRLLVQPRASRTEVCGAVGDRLKVRLRSAPVEGRANAELLRFLCKRLRVSSGRIHLAAGERGRRKEVLVAGVSPSDVHALLVRE